MGAITLNGTTFYASDVQETGEKIGVAIQAANGARRWAQRANKRSWQISWKDVDVSVQTAVRNVFNLTTTFTFVDENGNSATVLCEAGAFKSTVATIGTVNGAQVLYYNVDLTLMEA